MKTAFKAGSPLLRRLSSICLSFPETKMEIKWGHPVFVAGKKMFASFGQDDEKAILGFKAPDDQFDSLCATGRFYPAPYAARFNWVCAELKKPINWNELTIHLEQSYRLVALKRMVSELDAKAKE